MFLNYITIGFLFWLQIYYSPVDVDACAATGSPGTVTTTTEAPTECGSCTLDNPAIEHVQNGDGAKDIETDVVTIGDDGCALRTFTCLGTGPGSTVLLAWNDDAAGITQGVTGANTVTDTLTCSDDGTNWILTHIINGVEQSRAITRVECVAT